jgi:hypothetical protein
MGEDMETYEVQELDKFNNNSNYSWS